MIILIICLIISIGINTLLGILLNRSLNYSQERELNLDSLIPMFRDFRIACNDLLSREIYSNDPVIQDFVHRLAEINGYLKNVNENYDIENEEN